ncbi:MAG: hypothetical protein ACRDL6_13255 [Solirubrobacterales bacterium]
MLALACAALAASAAAAYGAHLAVDTLGHTTLEQTVGGPNPDDGYTNLAVQEFDPDAQHLVRDGAAESSPAIPNAQPGRESRRTSLSYFTQLSDFQLADEESPARVEFLDPGAASAWRPQEAFTPFMVDAAVRQMNAFADASPVAEGDGDRAQMDFSILTGDLADSSQRNEMTWVRDLIEGNGPTNFNSGINPDAAYKTEHPSCNMPGTDEGATPKYTGVQDRSDFPTPPGPAYYDPNVDDATGTWADWPVYPGLLDRAQSLEFTPIGADVPVYVANGNHDVLVQGNEDANASFEDIGMGCFKLTATTVPIPPPLEPDPNLLLGAGAVGMVVPPDPARRFLSKQQTKAIYAANGVDNAHGFGFVDPAELAASNDSASYYSWSPPEAPGFRFISLDTNSEGGQTAEGVGAGSANGNIDDPQFQWLRAELDAAKAADELVVLFGHHPIRSLNTEIVDEQAAPCTTTDSHPGDDPQHDLNPGCDSDPRVSVPVHLGEDPMPGDPRESLVELLDGYPHVLTYVAGHTHENRVTPFPRSDGTVWWGIETSAEIDWPTQSRLIEVMDNHDGTLSIFGTLLDQASPAEAPAAGPAEGFDADQLAAVGRTVAYNDPQVGDGSGEGAPQDQNVELLVFDPRDSDNGEDPDPGGNPGGGPPNPGGQPPHSGGKPPHSGGKPRRSGGKPRRARKCSGAKRKGKGASAVVAAKKKGKKKKACRGKKRKGKGKRR